MKGPDAGDQAKRPRIPENNPILPEPSEVPLEAFEVPTDEVTYRNMLGSGMTMNAPASGDMTAVATTDLGDVALLNQLGTTRPGKIVAAFSATKEFFFLIPVASTYEGGIEVTYEGSRAHANFYKTLAAVDRLVPEGTRDFYPLKPTPKPITVGTLRGYALYCKLASVSATRVNTLSEETKAKRAETRRRNKEKKNGGNAAAAGN